VRVALDVLVAVAALDLIGGLIRVLAGAR